MCLPRYSRAATKFLLSAAVVALRIGAERVHFHLQEYQHAAQDSSTVQNATMASAHAAQMYAEMSNFLDEGTWKDLVEPGQKLVRLGAGSFGVAVRARLDPLTCKCPVPVVIKSIKLGDKAKVSDISRELDAQIKLGPHPNIMGVYDFYPRDQSDWKREGSVYIMMPEALGGNLDELYRGELARANLASGNMNTMYGDMLGSWQPLFVSFKERNRLIAKIAVDLSRGLSFMHEHGFLHRDIKPANIWGSSEGCIRQPSACKFMLGDLGLAVSIDDAEANQQITGTAHYMPPEIGYGTASSLVNVPRSGWHPKGDVFGLGLSLLELLVKDFWRDMGSSVMDNTIPGIREHVAGVPESLLKLLEGMLKANVTDRIDAKEAHMLAAEAYRKITWQIPEIPAVDTPPDCVAHCRSMDCCYSLYCDVKASKCKEGGSKASALINHFPFFAKEKCYGVNKAPKDYKPLVLPREQHQYAPKQLVSFWSQTSRGALTCRVVKVSSSEISIQCGDQLMDLDPEKAAALLSPL